MNSANLDHVVSERDLKIYLKFPGLTEILTAKVVIRDEEHDIALLKFDNDTLAPLKRCDEGKIKEGMEVIFSGYPLSLSSLTTHQGTLSAIMEDATGVKTYLIDGTVNAGNSGCPLMNKDGEVIGVVNAKRRESNDLLDKVESMMIGAISLHGVDLSRNLSGRDTKCSTGNRVSKLRDRSVSVSASNLYPEVAAEASVQLVFADGSKLRTDFWRVTKDGKAGISSFDHRQQYGLPAPIECNYGTGCTTARQDSERCQVGQRKW